jgi:hypothetical protein
MQIAILEDNADRQAAMRDCLSERFHQYEVHLFDDSHEFIRFADQHLTRLIAIALDHDLELKPDGRGGFRDPGTGRDVVDFLVERPPVCGVALHSTNRAAMTGMEAALCEAGWQTECIHPYDDLSWIAETWFPAMRRIIVHGPRVQAREVREPV